MKFFLLVVSIGVMFRLNPVLSGRCDNTLYAINNELEREIQTHRMYYVPNTYIGRTRHVLEQLNAKINEFGRGTGQCSSLERDIVAKLNEHHIENEGLEDMLTRLRKLFQFLDQRHLKQLDEIENEKRLLQECLDDKNYVEQELAEVNRTKTTRTNEIKDLKAKIKILTEEKRRLQAKLNNNAPTINVDHGIAHPGCYNYIVLNNTSLTNETGPTTDERTDITEKDAMLDLRTGSGSPSINGTNTEATRIVTKPTSNMATGTTTTQRPTLPRAAKGGNKSERSNIGNE